MGKRRINSIQELVGLRVDKVFEWLDDISDNCKNIVLKGSWRKLGGSKLVVQNGKLLAITET